MKKLSRLAILGFAALVVTAAAAPPALAGCSSNVFFGQQSGLETGYQYFHIIYPAGAATDAGTVVGRYWDVTNNANNNGAYDDSQWITINPLFSPLPYLLGDLQRGAGGCPAADVMLVIETTGTGAKSGQSFLAVSRVDRIPSQGIEYNFNRTLQDIVLKPVSLTKVSESRVGGVVTVTVAAPQASTYFTGAGPNGSNADTAITGWTVVRKNAATVADDTRATAGWTSTGTTLTSGGQSTVTVDCGAVTSQDVLLGLQPVLQTGLSSNFTSQSAVVKCSGNIAEPGGNFKIIDRKPAPRPVTK